MLHKPEAPAKDRNLRWRDDSQGRIVAASNDTVRSENARLNVTLSHAGAYFLSLIDVNDQGGPLFHYRLTCRIEK